MEKLGIFFSDASFDHTTKTGSIGFFNLINKKEYSFVVKAINPTDAEMIGMRKILEVAKKEEILDVIIISDSKNGISRIKKEIYEENQKQKEIDLLNDMAFNGFRIRFLQFLWIPREYNQIADMLSKNIHEKDIEEFSKLKEENIKEKKNKINEKVSKMYVKDVQYSKNTEGDALDIRLKEFRALCEINSLSLDDFSSEIFKMILKGEAIDLIESAILEVENISSLEKDISEMKNILIKLNAEIIKDLLIFN